MTEIPKLISNSLFDRQMKDVKIPKDKSQFIVDLSKNQIICTKCKKWVRLGPIMNGTTEIFSIEQIKANFKNKHLKSCK